MTEGTQTAPETIPVESTSGGDTPEGQAAAASPEGQVAVIEAPAVEGGAAPEGQVAVVEARTVEGADPGEADPAKLNQAVLITEVGPCRKHIRVTIDHGDIEKLFNEKYKELVGDSWIPGFRPGKAPRQVVIRKFRKDVHDQVKGQVLMASLEQLAVDHDIAPLSPPNLDPKNLEIPEKGDFIYEFEVEVRPHFDLPNYKGLKLKRPVRTFTDEDVTHEEHRILSKYGQLIPKEGPAEKGDYVIVDMTNKFKDQTIGTGKEVTIRVDDTLAFKDGVANQWGEKAIGALAGDTRVVDITMTDAVSQPELKGQTVQATLEIKDVKKLRLPELTHDFLHEFGVHSVEQFREQIRILLERKLEYDQKQSARTQIMQFIVESSTWDLPTDMLRRQARKAMQRRLMEMREAGISEDDINARQRLLERDVLQTTALTLKEHFVLQKIAEVEKLEISEDEIDLEIEVMADQAGETPRKVRAQLEKEDMIETLAAQLIERKALDIIFESAEWEEVQIGKEAGLASSEAQAIPGQLQDPTAAPPEAKPQADEPK